jgi:hypothetical protein
VIAALLKMHSPLAVGTYGKTKIASGTLIPPHFLGGMMLHCPAQ